MHASALSGGGCVGSLEALLESCRTAADSTSWSLQYDEAAAMIRPIVAKLSSLSVFEAVRANDAVLVAELLRDCDGDDIE